MMRVFVIPVTMGQTEGVQEQGCRDALEATSPLEAATTHNGLKWTRWRGLVGITTNALWASSEGVARMALFTYLHAGKLYRRLLYT